MTLPRILALQTVRRLSERRNEPCKRALEFVLLYSVNQEALLGVQPPRFNMYCDLLHLLNFIL